MAKTSEITFGSRVANAEKISAAVKTFLGYVAPTPDTAVANYDTLISSLKSQNGDVATKKNQLLGSGRNKAATIFKNKDSVTKSLTPITAALKAKIGKKAKPVSDLVALVTKIRGEKKAKPKDPKPTDANAKEPKETISQSERSYGSITQNFNDIITTLTALSTDYAPANVALKLPALNAKLAAITTANIVAANSFVLLKTSYATRSSVYDDIHERTQRIKDQVKSQYGISSTEYKLIKGLKSVKDCYRVANLQKVGNSYFMSKVTISNVRIPWLNK